MTQSYVISHIHAYMIHHMTHSYVFIFHDAAILICRIHIRIHTNHSYSYELILRVHTLITHSYENMARTNTESYEPFIFIRIDMMHCYGMAMISRLLRIISLFCRIQSLLQGSFAKETYHFKVFLRIFAEYCLFYRALVQKRPTILRYS